MKEKLVLLNDLCPEVDEEINGPFYEQENKDTGVIYRILNVVNQKSYIGRAFSYIGEKNQRHGSIYRFKIHWQWAHNTIDPKMYTACPIFYDELRESNIDDWFVFVLKVCPKNELKDKETKQIQKHKTSDPKYGYNVFVGNNKPDNEEHLKKYQSRKAESNTNRAVDGKMKRVDHNKKLPTYISYYPVEKDGKMIAEGYMARIIIDGKTYKKVFISMEDSMKRKLCEAVRYIELVKRETLNGNKSSDKIPKGIGRSVKQSEGLPKNVRYYTCKKNGEVVAEGYCVEMKIANKRHKKVFVSCDETMESKLEKAKQQVEIFNKIRQQEQKKQSGSKSSGRNL